MRRARSAQSSHKIFQGEQTEELFEREREGKRGELKPVGLNSVDQCGSTRISHKILGEIKESK